MSVDSVPIGSIFAYVGPPSTIPSNWLLCDIGTSLNVKDYPDLFGVIGTENGSIGSGAFNIPALAGCFLRGAIPNDDVLRAGRFAGASTGIPSSWSITMNTTGTDDECGRGTEAEGMLRDTTSQQTLNLSGGDNETRPVNMYVLWIIKAEFSSSNIAGSEDIPAGAIFPWAGEIKNSPAYPKFVPCDGSSIDQSKKPLPVAKVVKDLFCIHPTDPWTTPNLVGRFPRGEDKNGLVDPDSGDREPNPSGDSNTLLGTWQKTGTKIPSYAPITVKNMSQNQQKVNKTGTDGALIVAPGTGTTYTGANFSGLKESAPDNVAAQYLLCTGLSSTIFPPGGIIAIPANDPSSNLNSTYWRRCDGSEVDNASDGLKNALQTLWGTPSSDNGVVLPNLLGQFIRGANDGSNSRVDWDPYWNERSASAKGGAITGTGSYQKSCTGLPTKPINFNMKVANDQISAITWDGPGSVGMSNNPPAATTFNMDVPPPGTQNSWDSETAPACWYVSYYMRIM